MKRFKKVIACLLVLMCAGVYVGCDASKGFEPVDSANESKRVEIKVLFDGYGTSWAYAMAKRFNEIWGDEGYEVVVTQADPQLTVTNDILTPKKNTTDIFFEYNRINQLVEKSRSIYKNNNCLLEDLTDVFESRPLNANKEEEGEKIIDRINPFMEKAMSYSGQLKGYDGKYGFPWHGGTVGLYANMGAIQSRGYSSEDLLTTDRLISMVNGMKPADLLDASAFFPVSWSANKAPGYWDYMFQTLLGQYIGNTDYQNLYNFIPSEGTVVDNGYSVYDNDGIVKALDVITALTDKDLAVPGTSSLDHVQAQARVFRGNSALMVSGDWIFKECEADYGEYLENVIAVKMPLISELGVKLDLLGTGSYEGQNRKNCDDTLAAIVKDVDAGTLTNAQIADKFGASVTEEKVAVVRERRNTVYGGSNWFYNQAHIPSYSDAKTGAKLFLRFMYSDEGMSIYKRETYVDLPSAYTNEPSQDNYTNFMKSLTEKTSAPDTTMLIPDTYSTTLRSSSGANIPFFPGYSAQVYADLSYSHSTTTPQLTVSEVFEKINKEIKAEWDMYLRTAGLV